MTMTLKGNPWFLVALFCLGVSRSPYAKENVIFERDDKLPIVYLNVVLPMGSAHDPAQHLGLTRLAAELLVRGTKSKSKLDFENALESLGARLEAEVRNETTILRSVFLSEKISGFLNLLGEMLSEPRLNASDFKKLKTETISKILEIRGNDTALAKMWWPRAFYGNHPYGNPALGTIEGVEKVTLDDVKKHLKLLLSHRNLTLVGSGDSDQTFLASWYKGVAMQLPDTEPTLSLPPLKLSGKRRLFIIDKKDRTQTQIYIGQPGISMNDERFLPLTVANHVFGGKSFNARLMQEVREKRGWSYGAYSSFTFGREPRTWHMYVFPKTSDTAPAVQLLDAMSQSLKKEGVSESEFDFVKTSLVQKSGFNFNTALKRMENTILELSLQLPLGFNKEMVSKLASIKYKDSQKAIQEFVKPEEFVFMVLGTSSVIKSKIQAVTQISEDNTTVITNY